MATSSAVSLVLKVTGNAVRQFNRIDSAVGRLERNAKKASHTLTGLDKAMGAMAVGGAAAFVAMGVRAAGLEDRMARLKTVTKDTGKTISQALDDAKDSAVAFSTTFNAATNATLGAQFELATAGVAVADQMAAAQAASRLAAATVGEVTGAARLLGQVLNTFGREAEFSYLAPVAKMNKITDILSETVQRFQVTLPVLQEGLKFVVGPATQLGLSFSETATALGQLNSAGFRGTLAGTALSNIFNKIDKAVDELDLDPSKFTDMEGKLISLSAFMGELNSKLSNFSPLEGQTRLMKAFDVRAGRAIKTLADGAKQLEKYTLATEMARGATLRMSNIIDSTTSQELGKMINAIDNLAAALGTELLNVIKPIVVGIKTMIVSFSRWIKGSELLAIQIAATGVAITSILFVMGFMKTKIGVMIVSMFKLQSGLSFLQAAMMAVGIRTKATTAILATQGNVALATAGKVGILGAAWAKLTGIWGIAVKGAAALWAGLVALNTGTVTWTIALQAAKRSLQSLLVLIPGWGWAVLAVAVAYETGLLGAMGDWISSLWESNEALDKHMKKLEMVRAGYFTTENRIADLRSEMGLLSRAANANLKVADLQESTGSTKTLVDAIKRIAGETGMVTKEVMGKAMEEGGRSVWIDFAKAFAGSAADGTKRWIAAPLGDTMREVFKSLPTLDPLRIDENAGERAVRVLQITSEAMSLAIRSISNDSKQGEDAYRQFTKSLTIAFHAQALEKSTELVEDMTTAVNILSKNFALMKDTKYFGPVVKELEGLGLTMDMTEAQLRTFVEKLADNHATMTKDGELSLFDKLQKALKSSDKGVLQLTQDFAGLGVAVVQSATNLKIAHAAMGRVDKAFEDVRKGSNNVGLAISGLDVDLNRLRATYVSNIGVIARYKDEMAALQEKMKAGLSDDLVQSLDDLRKNISRLGEDQLKIKASIDDGELKQQLISLFGTQTNWDAIPDGLKNAINRDSKAIAATIESALGDGNFDIGAGFTQVLQGQLKTLVAKEIGPGLAAAINAQGDKLQLFKQQHAEARKANMEEIKGLTVAGKRIELLRLESSLADDLAMKHFGIKLSVDKVTDAMKAQESLNVSLAAKKVVATGAERTNLERLQKIDLTRLKTAQDIIDAYRVARTVFESGGSVSRQAAERVIEQIARVEEDNRKKAANREKAFAQQAAMLNDQTSAASVGVGTDLLKSAGAVVAKASTTMTGAFEKAISIVRAPSDAIQSALVTAGDVLSSKVNEAVPKATSAVDRSINSLTQAMQNVASAADKMASTLTPVFEKFHDAAKILEEVANSGVLGGSNNTLIKIDAPAGNTDFDVNITQSGGTGAGVGGIDEEQIRQIMEEYADKVEKEAKERIRALEARLRSP